MSIKAVAEENAVTLRPVPYLGSALPALLEALSSQYSGTFLMAVRIRGIANRMATFFDHFPGRYVFTLYEFSPTSVANLGREESPSPSSTACANTHHLNRSKPASAQQAIAPR